MKTYRRVCKECGKRFVYEGQGRPRLWCSDACRVTARNADCRDAYWHARLALSELRREARLSARDEAVVRARECALIEQRFIASLP